MREDSTPGLHEMITHFIESIKTNFKVNTRWNGLHDPSDASAFSLALNLVSNCITTSKETGLTR